MFTGDLLNFSLFPVVDQLVLHVVFSVCLSEPEEQLGLYLHLCDGGEDG